MGLTTIVDVLYVTAVLLISIYGLSALVITVLFLLHLREQEKQPPAPADWPTVTVQIPLYNEQCAALRLIDSVCAFDYPRDKLTIQVLDDSTDKTTELVRERIQAYEKQGWNIQLKHRFNRQGYKAGALQEGFEQTDSEFIAIFDADFLPAPDYLRRLIPRFALDEKVGLVQARWGYLNRFDSLITGMQALFLDGHQVVEQAARSRSHLLLNFNGTGGVWRSQCIRDSGGWHGDTLAEDMDISYHAQIRGWRILFVPDVFVPGEVPDQFTTFKNQQFRWVFGHIQVLRKLFVSLWTAPGLTLPQRLGGWFHLSANFMQIAAMLMFLLSVPMILLHPQQPSSLGAISMASAGPTILYIISQIFGYHDGFLPMLKRLAYIPLLVLSAIGLTISNSVAVISVFTGRRMVWSVTPKSGNGTQAHYYKGQVPLVVWLEIAFSIYCAVGLSLALHHAPALIPLSALGMLSYGYVGFTSLVEANRMKKDLASTVKTKAASE